MDLQPEINRRSLLATSAGVMGLSLLNQAAAQSGAAQAAEEPGKLSVDQFEKLLGQMQPSKSCRLLPRKIDDMSAVAQVIGGFLNGTYFLHVAGKKPSLNMQVKLSPLVYTKQPAYWEIEVVGCMSGIALPAIGLYHETISIDQVRGTKGIIVKWADDQQQFEIPAKSESKPK
jgi:hypothetical protein